ncbi:unnamed protein product [Urochloa decumbens]|uniref:Uncharacterized protein n=1 Tax=Urochloa decumbens TaxID=240449 RepID=A0ABC9GB06_9POAL
MSRYLRRAALATAAAAALSAAAMRSASDDPTAGRLPPPPAYCAAPGHLGLARAHPSLAALLTPESFLLDAAHALAAAALRAGPVVSAEAVRQFRRDGRLEAAIAADGPEEAPRWRLAVALHDAEEGRFDDALGELARLAAERPSDARPRLAAAGICYLAGLPEEGSRWVSGIPAAARREHKRCLRSAVLAAALGGAPRAADGFEGLVGWAVFEVVDMALGAKFIDGDINFLKRRFLSAVLWRSVFADEYKDYHKAMVAGAPSSS